MEDLNATDAGTVTDGNATVAQGVDNAWLSSVPENLRGNEALKGHSSLPEALQSYIDLKVKSGNMIAKPNENSTPEDIAAYRKAIDVPDTVEGYEVSKPEDWPKDEQGNDKYLFDEAYYSDKLKILLETGAPKSVVQAMHNADMAYNIQKYKEFEAFKEERATKQIEALKSVWKEDYDKKNLETKEVLERYAKVAKVPDGFGGAEGLKELIGNVQTDPIMNWFINSLFAHVGNDSFIGGSNSGGSIGSDDPVFSSYKQM